MWLTSQQGTRRTKTSKKWQWVGWPSRVILGCARLCGACADSRWLYGARTHRKFRRPRARCRGARGRARARIRPPAKKTRDDAAFVTLPPPHRLSNGLPTTPRRRRPRAWSAAAHDAPWRLTRLGPWHDGTTLPCFEGVRSGMWLGGYQGRLENARLARAGTRLCTSFGWGISDSRDSALSGFRVSRAQICCEFSAVSLNAHSEGFLGIPWCPVRNPPAQLELPDTVQPGLGKLWWMGWFTAHHLSALERDGHSLSVPGVRLLPLIIIKVSP